MCRIEELDLQAEAQGLVYLRLERLQLQPGWKAIYWLNKQPRTVIGTGPTPEDAILSAIERAKSIKPIPKSTFDLLEELGL